MKTLKFKDFMLQAFSEKGSPSSKRICGAFIIIVVMFCTVFSVVKYGMTRENEAIIQTEIISGAGLLGLSSVTRIWSKDKKNEDMDE